MVIFTHENNLFIIKIELLCKYKEHFVRYPCPLLFPIESKVDTPLFTKYLKIPKFVRKFIKLFSSVRGCPPCPPCPLKFYIPIFPSLPVLFGISVLEYLLVVVLFHFHFYYRRLPHHLLKFFV